MREGLLTGLQRLALGLLLTAAAVYLGTLRMAVDDRVVPLHSYKFAAALQAAQGGEAPVLLRVDQAAGHGAGKPSAQVAAEWTDLLAFAAAHTGLHPHG